MDTSFLLTQLNHFQSSRKLRKRSCGAFSHPAGFSAPSLSCSLTSSPSCYSWIQGASRSYFPAVPLTQEIMMMSLSLPVHSVHHNVAQLLVLDLQVDDLLVKKLITSMEGLWPIISLITSMILMTTTTTSLLEPMPPSIWATLGMCMTV